MIVLHGMSDEQAELLNKMWSIDTEEEFKHWHQSLPRTIRQEVEVLKELILLESIEQELLAGDISFAQLEIKKIMCLS